jgi:demethylmenaquinone methyltransferase / 2-methoxy-6-polyprenyl-1,4-benzoquinol methylase
MPEPRVPGNPAPAGDVRAMFDRIAPIYDRMNTVMTAGLDAGWRRAAVRAAELAPGMRALDVACGSGAITRELARGVGSEGAVIGVDVSAAMLRHARSRERERGAARPEYRHGDALALRLPDGSFDAATIGFGLRNVGDYRGALAEMTRVVRVGGRVVVLEVATPRGAVGRALAAAWLRRIVPLLGRAAGAGAAYRYLPDSVTGYPDPEQIADLMTEVGLAGVEWRRLALGMVTLHVGRRA